VVLSYVRVVLAVGSIFELPGNGLAFFHRQADVILQVVLFGYFETGEFPVDAFHGGILPYGRILCQTMDLLFVQATCCRPNHGSVDLQIGQTLVAGKGAIGDVPAAALVYIKAEGIWNRNRLRIFRWVIYDSIG
jgi:hypothetical protein